MLEFLTGARVKRIADMMAPMATASDKKWWDDLHAAQAKAYEAANEYERQLRGRYGYQDNHWRSWITRTEKEKLESLESRTDKIGDKIIDLLVHVSPRGETWLSGAPSWWIRHKLTWEDAIRPSNDSLSVVVPGAYGYPDGYVKEQQQEEPMEIQIPAMAMWEQIGGDVNPGAYGGLLARSDGDALELLEIQPVREFVGDEEAADVGFPFWTKEGWYDADALDPNNKDVRNALKSGGLEDHDLEEMSPTQRALAIAEALMHYGTGVDEGQSGWSKDVVPDRVKWWGGTIAGPEYLTDEDDEFRREVLGEEDDEDEDDEEDDDDEGDDHDDE